MQIIYNTLKYANFGQIHAIFTKIGSYDDAWYTEHNDIICVDERIEAVV